MTETLLPQLQDFESRQAVVDAVFALFARWQLHEINQARLLGLDSVAALKQYQFPEDTFDVLENIGNLLAIDRALLKAFPYQSTYRDRWVFQSLDELSGETPLSVMLSEGKEGIRKVRKYLESLSPDKL